MCTALWRAARPWVIAYKALHNTEYSICKALFRIQESCIYDSYMQDSVSKNTEFRNFGGFICKTSSSFSVFPHHPGRWKISHHQLAKSFANTMVACGSTGVKEEHFHCFVRNDSPFAQRATVHVALLRLADGSSTELQSFSRVIVSASNPAPALVGNPLCP